eukprot:1873595-Amphidinium_carterae.1
MQLRSESDPRSLRKPVVYLSSHAWDGPILDIPVLTRPFESFKTCPADYDSKVALSEWEPSFCPSDGGVLAKPMNLVSHPALSVGHG